jgi:hypothetical protein
MAAWTSGQGVDHGINQPLARANLPAVLVRHPN